MCKVSRTAWRAGGPAVLHLIALLIALPLWAGLARPAVAQALKGEVSATVENGYARLVFQFDEEIEAQVRLANNILTVNFPRPVDISIDRISQHAAGYVSVARRDPDGKGIRIALARKVTLNSMAAGERLFVDLLPDTWVGLAPGLPRDVIEELARRAREAERRVRAQRALAQQQKDGADPRAGDQPADLHALCLRPARAHRRVGGQYPGEAHADLRCDTALRPGGRQGDAAADDRIHRQRKRPRCGAGALQFRRPGRRAHLPRGQQLCRRRRDGRTQDRAPGRIGEVGRIVGDGGRSWPSARTRRRNGPAPKSVPARKAAAAPPEQRAAPAQPQPPPAQQPPAQQQAAAPPPAAAAAAAAARATASNRATGGHAAAKPAAPPLRRKPPSRSRRRRHRSRRRRRLRRRRRATPPRRSRRRAGAGGAVRAVLKRNGENVSITFPFAAPTPAAVFRRADTVWMVFDTDATVGISALNAEQGKAIRSASATRVRNVALVRVKLERPQLISVAADGNGWVVTLGNEVVEPTRPLAHQPPHHPVRALDRHHRDRRTAQPAPPRGSRRRRLALRDYGGRAGARLPQVAGFCRFPRAGVRPRRRLAAAGRRSQRRPVGRQDRGVAPRRIVSVGGGEVEHAGAVSAACPRRPILGVRPPGQFHRTQDATDASPRRTRRNRSGFRRAAISRASILPATCTPRRRRCSMSRSPTIRRRPRTPRRWCSAPSPIS